MSSASWLQFVALIVVVVGTAIPLGRYMAKVYGDDETAPGDRFFGPIERLIYRVCRVDPEREQRWTVYAYSLLGFSIVSFLVRLRASSGSRARCRCNPTDVPAVVPHLSFNTAVSFMTNTNWQSYGGEATMSHLTQMVGLAVQNFVSAAAGMATMAALIRGLARRRSRRPSATSGWTSPARTVRILLPLAFVFAVVLVSQGVIQNFDGFTAAADGGGGRGAAHPRRPGRPARSPSSSSAPTAAASSTSTPPTRSRTRRRSTTSSRPGRSSSSRSRSRSRSVTW